MQDRHHPRPPAQGLHAGLDRELHGDHHGERLALQELLRLPLDDLVAAAGSLGVGVDYDAQAPAFYGQVPKPDSEVKKAQEFIGQGGVLASPLAMAGLAASVASGHTVVPWLVASAKPAPVVEGR